MDVRNLLKEGRDPDTEELLGNYITGVRMWYVSDLLTDELDQYSPQLTSPGKALPEVLLQGEIAVESVNKDMSISAFRELSISRDRLWPINKWAGGGKVGG